MAIAFTFPGQGSQSVGMGKALAEQFSVAKQVFEEVDDALGEKLSQTMFEGPEDVLTLTANAQPALMAVSMAIIKLMQSFGLDLEQKVQYVAGHSLGEYSALCAAGMFSLADTAKLLRIRGNAMQKAVPVGQGGMAAIIGLDDDDVNAICVEVSSLGACQIANDNGGNQLVISGDLGAVEKAASLASKKGAKRALMLPVSSAFHSVLMQPAAEIMAEALANVEKHTPIIPLVANVTAQPLRDEKLIIELLVEQVTGQVRWRETVEWFGNNGVDRLYEIGTGKVLTGLARRINKDIIGRSVNLGAEIEETLKELGV